MGGQNVCPVKVKCCDRTLILGTKCVYFFEVESDRIDFSNYYNWRMQMKETTLGRLKS
ncbi:hypothetical protein I8751_02630 [Nostocaceae cyanobacterium CENA357]|uniref:Uncharacterized protein n=1 Tax=Atlanticothrix silvestris CENA357 TaxID=1725252 RepID=A0A8J7H774_9CYAN|nr:hypothetical protein [Atlanticothrix silvestris CENA357]